GGGTWRQARAARARGEQRRGGRGGANDRRSAEMEAAAKLVQSQGQTERARLAAESDRVREAARADGVRAVGLATPQPAHQSARYVLSTPDGQRERQLSSGVVIGTGTGATGWCAPIAPTLAPPPPCPAPGEPVLCWFVREAWPSPATGVSATAGQLTEGQYLDIISESERLVVFADGLEHDRLELAWAQRIRIGLATRSLSLVVD